VPNGKGRGIELFTFDSENGSLTPLSVQGGTSHLDVGHNPTWIGLHPSKKVLYAALETDKYDGNGAVSSYRIKEDGALEFINKVSSKGTFPCHFTVDPTGKYLVAANYGSGNLPVLKINDDGSLGDLVQVIQHSGSSVNKARQEGPHAHQAVFDSKHHLFAVDLGTDAVLNYKLDQASGKVVANTSSEKVSFNPGAGPRHLDLHPSEPFAFVLHELDSTISTCHYDSTNGTLKVIETISTVAADFKGTSSPGEVAVSHDGKFVYSSNRGPETIAVYKFSPTTPHLELIANVPTEGTCPRHFTLSPDSKFLLAANQNSDNLAVFKVDPASGLLHKIHVYDVGTPVCALFLHQ